MIPLTATLDMLTRKRFAVRVGCEIHDAQVNAQDTFSIDRLWDFNLTGNKQIPLATDEREIGFTALCSKQFALAVAAHKRDRLSPVQCPDRNLGTFEVVGQDTIVVGNRAVWLKRALCLTIQFVGIRDFGDTAHRQL